MDMSKYLATTQLWDCQGNVTHTLTLLPDGNVEVKMGSIKAVLDPARRTVLRPSGYAVSDEVFQYASILAREAMA